MIESTPRGLLAAAIDGIGHGPAAEEPAAIARLYVETHAAGELDEILAGCHRALVGSRGAVMSLARLDPAGGRLAWAGVGNVQGIHARPHGGDAPKMSYLLPRGGILGHTFPKLQVRRLPLAPGDVVFLATDGIRSRFSEDLPLDAHPQALAEIILHRSRVPTDDALVIALRMEAFPE